MIVKTFIDAKAIATNFGFTEDVSKLFSQLPECKCGTSATFAKKIDEVMDVLHITVCKKHG
jgi:hypothetical protein